MAYTGQLFVDDDINIQADKLSPYNQNPIRNKWGRTRNWRDSLNIFDDSHANGFNPVFNIEKLGGSLQEGVIGSITLGVKKSHVMENKDWKP